MIDPDEVDVVMAALRTCRDGAMVEVMLLGGLRRCEVLGLHLEHVRPGEHRLFIADGTGGHQRIVPVSKRFFATLAEYLETERPPSRRKPALADRPTPPDLDLPRRAAGI